MGFLSDRWQRFKEALAGDSGADAGGAGKALTAARALDQQATQLPEGSDARVRLVQIAEELRAYAAGEAAKAALAEYLADPEVKQILRHAGIKVD